MLNSPERVSERRRRRSVPPRTVGALILVGTLALALAFALQAALGVARAESPTLTVSLQASQSTGGTSTYKVMASGFGANEAITEAVGGGVSIPPTKGTTNASGGFTGFWTFDVTRKYCGTITATTASGSASASFWVAVSTDAASGTPCSDPNGGGGATTPVATASAAPSATATPVPTTAPPVAARQPAAPPASGTPGGGSIFSKLGRLPLLWIIAGVVGVILLIVVVFFVAVGMGGGASGQTRRRAGMPGQTSTRRRAVPGAPGPRPGYGQGFGPGNGQMFGPPGLSASRMPRYGPGAGQPPRGPGMGEPQWRSGSMGRVPGGLPRPGGGVGPRPAPMDHRWPDPPPVGQRPPGARGYTPGRQPTVGNHGVGGPRPGGPDPRWARSQAGARTPGEAAGRDGDNNSRWIR